MSDLSTYIIHPGNAANAYGPVVRDDADASVVTSFSGVLQNMVSSAIATGHNSEAQAMQAIAGEGNVTDVVTSLTRAELALQTATVVRDRVVEAYQDIMKMPI